ncbi:hypothetical protein CH274_13430 [Rhodococcus sp. 06-418-5]|uniref:DUF4326 domain-containing protein n=1 Tax=Rhodococcus sp. 06-418-5 TaxID=2022507 RepID=UPI000B9C6BB7|nr:hypothetical protein CH274_13430 [Rhodococcus sp. 06-418-5]
MPENTFYVGRPSRWGNPFRVMDGRSLVGPPWSVARGTWGHIGSDVPIALYVSSSHPIEQSEVVRRFETLMQVRARDEGDRLTAWLEPLRGRNLACWCSANQSCHADVLLDYANRFVS